MIRRFQKITQVGVFRNATGLGRFELERTVVCYGLNTFGKTTLKDIFQSLALNETDYILGRKSIPADASTQQEVVMSCMHGSSEKPYTFTPAGWDCTDLQGKIFVFDNDFIHKNLITGSEVTRENREALSDFILGEEGVKLSEEIRQLREKLRSTKMSLRTPAFFTNLRDLAARQQFLNLTITETKEELSSVVEEKKREISNLSKQTEIKDLPDLTLPSFTLETKISDAVTACNGEFVRDFKEVTQETLDTINDHVAKCMAGSSVQAWIKQGLKHKKTDDCPFCGQTVEGEAKSLLSAYGTYFNENYEKFAQSISQNLLAVETSIETLNVSIHSKFLRLQVQLQAYKTYDPSLKDNLNFDELGRLETELNEQLATWKKEVKVQIGKKNKEPHATLSDICLSKELNEAIASFVAELKVQTEKVKALIKDAKEFKDKHTSLTPTQVTAEEKAARDFINECEEKIARIDQNVDCVEYLKQQGEIRDIEQAIGNKTQELEDQQSGYIFQYFTDLTDVYSRLGSGDFVLESTTNNRGHKKIYELKVFYKGVEIGHEDVAKVMSESDKRSLALAIFLTKIKHQDNRNDYIIVLDDPVVSFDDNRISMSVDIIKGLGREFKQVFVLTHYPSLVKKLLQAQTEGAYIKIEKNANTSTFEALNTSNFVLSDYEIAFEKIYSFVTRQHSNDTIQDLRVYLENYLQMRFKNQIKQFSIVLSPLKDFIDGLKDNGVITDDQKAELHAFRESLNPSHHNFIGNSNTEDQRIYASNILSYLSNV